MKGSDFGVFPPISVGQWFVAESDNVESWCNGGYATREEAIAEGRGMYGDETFAIGVGEEIEIYPDDASTIIERLCETVYDDVGEVSECFLDRHEVSKEAKSELSDGFEKLIGEWLTKHGLWPQFCKIGRIETVMVPDVLNETKSQLVDAEE